MPRKYDVIEAPPDSSRFSPLVRDVVSLAHTHIHVCVRSCKCPTSHLLVLFVCVNSVVAQHEEKERECDYVCVCVCVCVRVCVCFGACVYMFILISVSTLYKETPRPVERFNDKFSAGSVCLLVVCVLLCTASRSQLGVFSEGREKGTMMRKCKNKR